MGTVLGLHTQETIINNIVYHIDIMLLISINNNYWGIALK